MTNTETAQSIESIITEMNEMAPEGQEWCEWSRRYVKLGMAAGVN